MATKNLATIYSAELEGITARLIEVEIDLNVGIHAFNIVGLPDKALNEARERVNSALKNIGVKPPNRENRKITINLAPADIKKAGSQYDLAIALGYLIATNQIQKCKTGDTLFLGELALDGRLRPINGALNIAQMAAEKKFTYLFLPVENANEAAAIKNINVIGIENLGEAIEILQREKSAVPTPFKITTEGHSTTADFSEIVGQENAKRALTIAAAGGHHVLMSGPPGVGKSFLAHAFAGILPKLEQEEGIEVTKIWSAAGLRPNGLISERPFRAPHQTVSSIALVGGGQDPRPGEISLAHRGVLFLDELPEFQRNALEALRQPMESGSITISRTKGSLRFPAKFILIAAMNPCPCGYYGDLTRECKCSAYDVIKYQKKISGPLLDRIDLQIKVNGIKIETLRNANRSQPSTPLIEIVRKARELQRKRFPDTPIKTNSEMTARETEEMTRVSSAAEIFLRNLDKGHLSPRGYYRLLKVARTIADLEENEEVTTEHLAEAFSYRIRQAELSG